MTLLDSKVPKKETLEAEKTGDFFAITMEYTKGKKRRKVNKRNFPEKSIGKY